MPANPPIIGQPLNRYEGRAKVTGRANYAADNPASGLLHAWPVASPIAAGEIARLDPSAAERAPGVVAVLHHRNVPALRRPPDDMAHGLKAGEMRPPFEDEKIYYAGQFVAVVLAETLEQARWAAKRVKVDYRAAPHALTLDQGIAAHGAKTQADEKNHRGDPDAVFAAAPAQVDATYTTPVEVHHAMELHATLAEWQDDGLVVHDSTQWTYGQPRTLAHVLGLPPEKVRVLAPFIGGGFGAKLFLWPHTVLAAVAARQLRRPVKFVLPRSLQFTCAGHRPATRQRVRLGAERDGRLLAILHGSHSHTSLVTDYVESCGEATSVLYGCANVSVTHDLVPVNVGTPTSMRAPGACPGTFALESAMDELALKLALDPAELRRRNVPVRDEDRQLPWSSIHFRDCIDLATQRFGWARRTADVGSMRSGREILGWGFASATWPAIRQVAEVRVELRADGTARVVCGTQDIGTGTYTVLAQVVSELTGLPFAKIEVAIGDSALPRGPISGGSMVTATVVPAVAQATRAALAQRQAGRSPAIGEARTAPGDELRRFSFRSFGAHCVEVRWDPEISRLRVARITTVVDAGRIINHKTARNQIEGALLMGLGMALLEESIYDPRSGRVANDNLADYHVAVHADAPQLDVTLLDRPDPHIGEFGAKGLGEIGITGIAAAIGNAVFHATGRRIRDLPITIEKLLA